MPILTLYKEAALPKLNSFLQACIALQEKKLTAEPWVPISSDYSRQTLHELISFLSELTQHNGLNYWNNQTKFDVIDKLHQQFTGGLYKFVPACFDQLSYEMSTLYLDFLNSINFNEDLTKATKALFFGKNLGKMLLFVKDNTQQSRELFELATASPSDLRYGNATENLETLFMLTTAKLAQSSGHSSSEVTSIMQEYEKQAKELLAIFLRQPLPKIFLYGFNGAYVQISEGNSVHIGQVIGATPMRLSAGSTSIANRVFDSVGILPGLRGVLLEFLLSKERELFNEAHNKGYRGELMSFGMLSEVKRTFNYEECDNRTQALNAWVNQVQKKLQSYINTKRPFISTDENKKILAQYIINSIQRMKDVLKNEPLFHYYNTMLGKLLSIFLQSSLDHNNLIKDDNISHGELGLILTQSLKELFAVIRNISIDNNPSIFCKALNQDEWDLFKASVKDEYAPTCTTIAKKTVSRKRPWGASDTPHKIRPTLLTSAWTLIWHTRLLNHSIQRLVPNEVKEVLDPVTTSKKLL